MNHKNKKLYVIYRIIYHILNKKIKNAHKEIQYNYQH